MVMGDTPEKRCKKFRIPLCLNGWYLLKIIDDKGKVDYICPKHCNFPDDEIPNIIDYDRDERNNRRKNQD